MTYVQIPNRLARVVAHNAALLEKMVGLVGAGEAIGSKGHLFVPHLSQLPRPYQSPRPFQKKAARFGNRGYGVDY